MHIIQGPALVSVELRPFSMGRWPRDFICVLPKGLVNWAKNFSGPSNLWGPGQVAPPLGGSDQKHGRVSMKSSPIPLTLLTLHPLTFISSQRKGKRFPDDAALISKVTTWLEDQPGVFYKNGVQSCIKRWEKCVTLGGSYVEKD